MRTDSRTPGSSSTISTRFLSPFFWPVPPLSTPPSAPGNRTTTVVRPSASLDDAQRAAVPFQHRARQGERQRQQRGIGEALGRIAPRQRRSRVAAVPVAKPRRTTPFACASRHSRSRGGTSRTTPASRLRRA